MVKLIAFLLFLLILSFGIGIVFYIGKYIQRKTALDSKKELMLKSDIKMMSEIITSIPPYLLAPSFRLAIGKVWQDRILKLSDIIGSQNKGVQKYSKQADDYVKKAVRQDRGEIIEIKTQEDADAIIAKLKSLYSIVSRLERRNRITKDIADKFNSGIHQAATRVTVELLQNNTSVAIENNKPAEAIANLRQVVKELKSYRGVPNHPYRQVLKDSVNSIEKLKQEIKLQNMLENKPDNKIYNEEIVRTQSAAIAQEFLEEAKKQNPHLDENTFKAENTIEKKLKW